MSPEKKQSDFLGDFPTFFDGLKMLGFELSYFRTKKKGSGMTMTVSDVLNPTMLN